MIQLVIGDCMSLNSEQIVEKFTRYFNLKESPIAFFYTDDPPQPPFKPHPKNKDMNPCIIQFLNGVRRGRTLVIGKESRRVCMGGMAYLGFKKMISGIEYFLSTGIPGNNPDEMFLEGERFKKTPEVARDFYKNVPFQKHPKKYAVFMPLRKMDLKQYTPDLVIFFVKMDQLGGLVQLFNYDTNNGITIGLSSACGSIVTEPLAEIDRKPVSRAVIGLLSDMLSRKHVGPDIASFTVTFNRLIQVFQDMDESFLKLDAWQTILKRIA